MSSYRKYRIHLSKRFYFLSKPLFIGQYVKHAWCSVLLVVLFFGSLGAVAQQVPDAGAIQNEIEDVEKPKNEEIPPEEAPLAAPTEGSGPKISVTEISFHGNTLLTEEELLEVVEPWKNKPLSLAELKYVANLVAVRYREDNHLVRVYLPQQDIRDGHIIIAIVEAKFGQVVVQNSQKIQSEIISPDFVTRVMSSDQKRGDTLNLKTLERATLLLNDLSGINAKNVLVAGERQGETDVSVDVASEQRYAGSVTIDNYGVDSTGETRVKPSFTIANPFHRGDKAQLIGLFSEGNQYARMSYTHPLTANGLQADYNTSYLSYSLGDEFEDLDAEGDSFTVGTGLTYPLVRQLKRNINISGRLEQREYENSQLGETISDKSITTLQLGLNGNLVDSLGKGGVSYYGANLVFGDLDLSGNKENEAQDAAGAKTAGSYSVLSWNLGRLQRVTEKTTIWTSLIGQFTDDKLDSSETISLGGPNGIRAYPVLEATGDTGAIFTFELRYQFDDSILLTGFLEAGEVVQKQTQVQAEDSHSLNGLGMSLAWTHSSNFSATIDIARRIGNNPLKDPVTGNDSNGSKTLWPIWIRVSKKF
ncbi:ShlB/FhaC/HecB family hemolysin secretion/activation protein [Teredinibacter sp. KSP-S5-2]|uniref:ShlB/FhaC/HecB family hemolysin secretion/activation protein n=1 Tax=Teredinibacter sp. KSP-S5-2 TaxID=3034506 RepID=UPI002934586D|nr:ShlB/FhaC/HecB family hemolysin secretion/activation protein [Teredinibacter sp. KSP-S5-2]WNO07825.1 ShlB/FhaC/HecB family hemolysin secretion/activation protein [Teredinibacter sp. KSP-S5-2]